MQVEKRELQVKILPIETPDADSDRAMFAIFDFLLTYESQLDIEKIEE
jgi:hypothetical protein